MRRVTASQDITGTDTVTIILILASDLWLEFLMHLVGWTLPCTTDKVTSSLLVRSGLHQDTETNLQTYQTSLQKSAPPRVPANN